MPRRRYRLFTVFAVVIVILLYRVVQNSWDSQQPPIIGVGHSQPPPNVPAPNHDKPDAPVKEQTPLEENKQEKPKADHVAQKVDDEVTVGAQKPVQQEGHVGEEVKKGVSSDETQTKQPNVGTMPEIDSTLTSGTKTVNDPDEEIPLQKPPTTTTSDGNDITKPTKVHWTKPKERFPLLKESIITLPTGTAKTIPKIQHVFPPEADGPKKKRLQRQALVKEEIQRSWEGYRKHAWMHDELRPVSNKSRDPFCGWAATLVDSLDTLWIAGLKDEFDEAAKAAKAIDFTHSNRLEIPVFETTIRYLGGLIAAYDVSGGASGGYSFLLDKAVELAEILMGIFDTPNRMPLMYYQWWPEYTSEPHQATRASMAELATLSLEFTRLAQLTAQHKYYDAIDRITNGLVDMQKAGTVMPGLFPENVDISGCNRTATRLRDFASKAAKAQIDSEEPQKEPEGYTSAGENGGASAQKPPDAQGRGNNDGRLERRAPPPSQQRDVDAALSASKPHTSKPRPKSQVPLRADGNEAEWDCVPQGFIPAGYQAFHMGGGQDSAYEYFGKEFLLLGGKEPKYQKLYEDTIDGINKHLLFRPMAQGDWDIAFPARVQMKANGDDPDVSYEVTHLTCFIGGMYALGGKLFGREKDIEYAKKLTDGCVWAYQSTATGIMPEHGRVIPCPTFEKCSFNESLWWTELDPMYDTRDQRVLDWEKSEAERERLNKEEAERQRAELERENKLKDTALSEAAVEDDSSQREKGESASSSTSTSDTASPLDKRAVIPLEPEHMAPSPSDEKITNTATSKEIGSAGDKPVKKAESEDSIDPARTQKSPTGPSIQIPTLKEEHHSLPKPPVIPENRFSHSTSSKPLTHKEYVHQKIKKDGIPPGFREVGGTKYILRPEAIESVWYMYRITGDPSWMEKGWTMFEATIKATRAPQGNSAIGNVLTKEPSLLNEMESFWLAETLKYYYLLFSGPDVISLDEWVLNTEAHPFKL